MLKGTAHPSNKHVYYPLSDVYNIRNHDDVINRGKLIEEETNQNRKDEMIRETGTVLLKIKIIFTVICIDFIIAVQE
jgi:hypothetical protein